MSEAMIAHGKLQGTFQRWYENGNLEAQIELSNDVAHGVSLGYFPSGFLRKQARMEEGNVVEEKSWEDGKLKSPLPDFK